ncbi:MULTISPECIES: hypothetical protein [unclassified Imperialibacter]|uniref:hypothetical protein n=1 Tax=unclassified Imperialibacter TaxID=2629706 RepID=UPI00125B8CE5|nr:MULTISPECIES: hypothetical protein [unclassified Imperialibacter]CAD5274045.1 conserved exported hypothetical protein [Imperialibacter sp. 75]CAD5287674.1 conserved exported hypothetical protein [Imperialibacter sp. 89]VVT35542.1 conserved exported hypothetical protein [Imperialibacter sp. EC-SDR9]
MKKLFRNLLFFSAIGSVAILASCGGDEEEPLPTAPSMEVEVEGVEVTGAAISAVEGETVTFTVTVTAPGVFNTLNVTPSVDGVAGTSTPYPRTASNVTLSEEGTVAVIGLTYTFDADDVDKDLSWTFEGVDDSNQTTEKTFTATVEAAPVEVVVYTETLIGGQSNATLGSFYDAEENKVYKYAETRDTHSASVDFLFFYGDTNKYAIAAMDDADANTAFSAALNVTNALSAIMPTKNATKFKVTTLTAAQFDAIGDVDALASAYGEVAADASKVNNLEAGKVFAFVQASARGSKKGLVKVVKTDGTSGTNRSITVTVKIEPSED